MEKICHSEEKKFGRLNLIKIISAYLGTYICQFNRDIQVTNSFVRLFQDVIRRRRRIFERGSGGNPI
jgi:hypothetical protein